MDKHLFRSAMSRFASSIGIITTDGIAGRSGFTATSICSVSDDPPLILVCVNRGSQRQNDLQQNAKLNINILASDQRRLSETFSDHRLTSQERFSSVDWTSGENGSPVLSGASVVLACEIIDSTDHGTHTVFYCKVSSASVNYPGDGPLIYFDRSYRSLAPLSAQTVNEQAN